MSSVASGIFFCIVMLSGSLIRTERKEGPRFVVWNIGQGQWTTLITRDYCDHFDIGGEFNLVGKVLRECQKKIHRVHISHWDWDHMSELPNMRKSGVPVCLWNTPLGSASVHKKQLLADLPRCPPDPSFRVIYKGDSRHKAKSNDTCEVVQTLSSPIILVPGDSTIKEEKIWARNSWIGKAHGLILGHHGSHTSTSDFLISHMRDLRWAVASARKKRFGHPHPEVLARLKKAGVAVLKTEEWGTLSFDLER